MLSPRLKTVAALIDPCDCLVDVGSDHGYLPLELIKAGKIHSAVICELRKKPLEKALANFVDEGFSSSAQFILSDGLRNVPSPIENVVIAGMGFDNILKIIQQDLVRFTACRQIVLQSNTRVDVVRQGLHDLGFHLMDEAFIQDRQRDYVILKYTHKTVPQKLSDFELAYGPHLLKRREAAYLDYLKKRLDIEKELSLYNPALQDRILALSAYLAL